MARLLGIIAGFLATVLLLRWYAREVLHITEATVRLQSEHDHFHLHVDMPPGLEIEPGDTVHILSMPDVPEGRTEGEITYTSPVHLYKASWLRRNLVKNSSLVEINELVEHP